MIDDPTDDVRWHSPDNVTVNKPNYLWPLVTAAALAAGTWLGWQHLKPETPTQPVIPPDGYTTIQALD